MSSIYRVVITMDRESQFVMKNRNSIIELLDNHSNRLIPWFYQTMSDKLLNEKFWNRSSDMLPIWAFWYTYHCSSNSKCAATIRGEFWSSRCVRFCGEVCLPTLSYDPNCHFKFENSEFSGFSIFELIATRAVHLRWRWDQPGGAFEGNLVARRFIEEFKLQCYGMF